MSFNTFSSQNLNSILQGSASGQPLTNSQGVAGLDASILNDYQDNLRRITLNSLLAAETGNQSAQQSSKYAYLSSIAEAIGQRNLNLINTYGSVAHSAVDQQNLLLRTNYGLAGKAQEMSLFVAQFRERFFNTFVEAEKARLDNTFQRSKQIVQSMKY